MDAALVIWAHGRPMSWDDFATRETGSVVLGFTYTMPSGLESLFTLVLDIVMYSTLAWYFDHVVSHNRGVAE